VEFYKISAHFYKTIRLQRNISYNRRLILFLIH